MSHPRGQIRARFRDVLAGVPGVAGRVFAERERPTDASELPCLLVFTQEEPAEEAAFEDVPLRRLGVGVGIMAQGRDETALEDQLHDLSWEIERVILAPGFDRRLGGLLCLPLSLQGTSRPDLERSGQGVLGTMVLTFECPYTLEVADPDTTADLESVHIDYDLAPADGTPDAQDDLALNEE